MSDHHHHQHHNSNNNWLGFSLSPQMKMELSSSSSSDHHLQQHHQAPFYISHHNHDHNQSHLYCVADNNNPPPPTLLPFQSPLSVMPLKSDGSLCIMEALSRSQPPHHDGIMPSSSPKLEDFLGGASLGTVHDYGGQAEREAMALSLDSIYYNNHHQNAESSEAQRDHNHQPQYYSGIPLHTSMYQTTPSSLPDQPQPPNWAAHMGPSLLDHESPTCVVSSGGPGGGVIACGELQSLTLSMSPGSQSSSCITAPTTGGPTAACLAMATVVESSKKRGPGKVAQKHTVHRKSIDTFGQRTSQYRGVTRHRWTGRYEAHLWDNSCKKEGQTRKGRQVYLGGYDMEDKAARAYDLAALKYWGPSTHINFSLENYQAELEEMKKMTRQEYVAHLRRKSSGFSRGASMYRGVTRHHQHGRWQARIGRVAGNKDLYLGTFSTQEEAAEAYDIAAIKFRGVNAVTNFDITRYDVDKIMSSNTLLAGELARRTTNNDNKTGGKESDQHHNQQHQAIEYNGSSQANSREAVSITNNNNSESNNNGHDQWKMALYGGQSPMDSLDQKSIASAASYRNAMSLQDLIGIDSVSSSAHQVTLVSHNSSINGPVDHQDGGKLGMSGGGHFSNPSSLVTSLGSSREGSPDKVGPSNSVMAFSRPPLVGGGGVGVGVGVSSWFPSTAISVGHLPVFAAWNDA